ncbi:Tesmin TSO1-like CXC domain containing protein [Musa troglodytarum]|uniref:Tesmin TSO1-like CXC domain containing protein n=1 Tax=Musa troglodytarum TaxID=320322 RepID=A0A9E7HY49_9LILI|nr:Tesmin TSO1-like CXC domain containing protein [Musa troglodytarum]
MEQSGQPAASAPSDFPPRKLVRHLDFTAAAYGGASSSAAVSVSLDPPQQPQQQPPPRRPAPASLPISRPAISSIAVAAKTESPKSRPRLLYDAKDGTPTRKKNCNCKHSKCLKLYCECFASGVYCDGCNCSNCCNNVENEAARHEAVEATLERNPNAFRPKIGSSPHASRDGRNFEGSEERKALFRGDHGSTLYMQQAANASLNGAIGPSAFMSPSASRKRKNQELFFGASVKDQPTKRLTQLPQARTSSPASFSASTPAASAINTAPMASTKVTYRSLLADVVQPEHIRDLCKLLVMVSGEVAETFADRKVQEKLAEKESQVESSLVPSEREIDQRQKDADMQKASADEHSSGNPAEKTSMEESESDCGDGQKGGRPMSPGTLALLCDEQDTVFMTSQATGTAPRSSNNYNTSEVYAEQERCVLTEFRDYLLKLVTYGRMKEEKYSSMSSKCEVSPCHMVSAPNGVARAAVPAAAEKSQTMKLVPPNSKKYPLAEQQTIGNGDIKPKIEKPEM